MRKWNARNPEKVKQAVRKYRRENPEKVRAFKREHYLANKKKYLEQNYARRKANPAKWKEYQDRYKNNHREQIHDRARIRARENYRKLADEEKRRRYLAHREKSSAVKRRYRIANLHKYASYAANRRIKSGMRCRGWISSTEKIYKRARELSQWFDVVVDHIVPIAKGGKHVPKNLQIIYRSENARKSTRLDYKPQVIFK